MIKSHSIQQQNQGKPRFSKSESFVFDSTNNNCTVGISGKAPFFCVHFLFGRQRVDHFLCKTTKMADNKGGTPYTMNATTTPIGVF
jgi:hypothetical protein